jgi:hypothetical protein
MVSWMDQKYLAGMPAEPTDITERSARTTIERAPLSRVMLSGL